MAGLLDAFNDPQFQRGLMMFAASLPQSEQSRAGLLSYMDKQEQAKLQRTLLEGQIQSQQLDMDQKRQAAQNRQQAIGLLGAWTDGSPIAPAQDVARWNMEYSPSFTGPQSPDAQKTNAAPRRTLENMPLETALQIENMGGPKDMREWVQAARTGIKREPGTAYQMADGSLSMVPKLGEGQILENTLFGGPRVSLAPGAALSNALYKGLETQGQEWGKVDPQTQLEKNKADIAARDAYMSGFDGQGNPAYRSKFDMRNPGGQGAAQGGASVFRPEPTAEQRAQQAALLTAAETQAKVDVTPAADKLARFDAASNAIGLIDKALAHPGLQTATGISSLLDPRNVIPGTDAKNFRVLLDQIKGGAFMNAYQTLRGGGQITEKEGEKAQAAVARMDSAQSTEEFMQGLKDYREVLSIGMDRARKSMGGNGPQQEPQQGPQQPQTSGRTFSELPKTGFKPGARMRDTQTGQILTFDGMRWK